VNGIDLLLGSVSETHYWVSEICKCLRQSYYELSNTPYDAEAQREDEPEFLWSLQSGKYLHNLTNSFRWRELDIEKEILFQDIDEKLYLHGRLDMYDYKTQTIIDLKTTNAIKWQYHLLLQQKTRNDNGMGYVLATDISSQMPLLKNKERK
jgi:hypothetical protein